MAGPVLHGVIACPSGVLAPFPVGLDVGFSARLLNPIGLGNGIVVGLGLPFPFPFHPGAAYSFCVLWANWAAMVPRTNMFCPSLVIPASSRGSHPRAAEEKENLCSASALARSSWGWPRSRDLRPHRRRSRRRHRCRGRDGPLGPSPASRRSCGRLPHVRVTRRPSLPRRPCRSPLASWPC